MTRLSVCLALLLLCFVSRPASSQQSGTPGNFDYYLLTLSWSPEYCHSKPNDIECTSGRHLGFVVHGLWPQFTNGSYPENCSNAPGLSNPNQFLDVMPEVSLIQHEWTTHGTCSGLSAEDYFSLIRRAFRAITIPSEFSSPTSMQTFSPAQIKADFEQANKQLQDSELNITCSGPYLSGLEICLTKSLAAMACPATRSCSARSIRVPPVR